ncbi:MAG: DNA gyrase subunit B [Parcubacteria group bacterium Gr01-1014_18]|nr:MAG: DNA gyrase subunit B [Parcubacteria group bacterium Greene0416_36]TSC79854.1 MAG: DNA gyrase subunit B [Parcubacteria group bacterium Gr01-1014_18]TSC98286.1 MAG: DNA gyrase subunit B [Parcubacteria group bacterium Greene1014_20]TSD06673.1 MAG: DNA gyrase subunit B [Parcubacteria group bacterium Greene0714_2]
MATNENEKVTGEYGAEQITVLEGLDPVRKRPGMYIGGTGLDGLHQLVWEIVDNAIDEAMAGHCDTITVKILPGNEIEVTDNGRGIPVDIHPTTKKSSLETVMTVLHAGGKFGAGGYKVSGGLHGVGASAVCALSDPMAVEVYRDGKVWTQEYRKGKPVEAVKSIGKTTLRGTKVTFRPDATIFPDTTYNRDTILSSLRRSAYLMKGLKINFSDLRNAEDIFNYCLYFEGGIASYIKYINLNKEKKHNEIFYTDKTKDGVRVEIALQYVDDYQENLTTFANNKMTPGGGTHMAGYKAALTRTINAHARAKNLLKEKDDNLTGEDTREGMTAILSVKIQEPQFEGQTKDKLGNPEVKSIVEDIFAETLAAFLEENPKAAEAIFEKCELAAKARLAARAARDSVLRKGVLEGLTLPGKLADCSSKKAENCELYIVEGDSAGGSAKQGRNREFQAILPLRGKLLNVEKSRIDRIINSETLRPLIVALGTNIGEMFDLSKLRYHRIVILADADVDGSHIRTLLLTFFYRYFRPLIDNGHLYIAQPPLYKIQKGKMMHYAYNDAEKEQKLNLMRAELAAKGKLKEQKDEEGEESTKTQENESPETQEAASGDEGSGEVSSSFVEGLGKVTIQRYKGLGEMNPSQLWETTLDPEQRTMKKISIEDAEHTEKIFDILMGSEVLPRKRFIETRAMDVKNLDI